MTKNVRGFVGFGKPVPLQVGEVEDLQKRESDGNYDEVGDMVHRMIEERKYKVGDFVTVSNGPFAGIKVQVSRIDGRKVYGTYQSYTIKLIDE